MVISFYPRNFRGFFLLHMKLLKDVLIFYGQADHESCLKAKIENLNYSIEGILKTFNSVKIKRISQTQAYDFG